MSLASIIRYSCLAAAALLVSSCSLRSYNSQVESFYNPYMAGDTKKAAKVVEKKAESRGNSIDGLLWRLEEGTVMLADGQYDKSLEAFTKAEKIVDDYDARASVNFRAASQEVASALSNPTAIAYKGSAYDRIMLNTYKCLAYIRKGDMEAAKVEMRRAYKRQQEAVEKYSKSIKKEQEENQNKGVSYEETRRKSGELRNMTAPYEKLDRYYPYGVYVNPFTSYLDGLLHLASYADGSDLERAKKNFERVKGMVRADPALDADIAAVENIYKGKVNEKSVHVIIENGVAPIRKQITINFPTPHPKVVFVSTSFPVIRPQNAPYEKFLVSCGGTPKSTEELASMDAIIVKEFQHGLPAMITRIIVNGMARSLAQYQAKKELGTLGMVGAAIYGAVVNRADLRTWMTLPKQFQFARFDRPTDGKLQVSAPGGETLADIDLPDADMTLVYIKVPSRGKASVQTIKLR